MGNSTTTLQAVVDFAKTFPDISPVLTTGGYSLQPALTIATDTMATMISQNFPFKWNRFNVQPFYTNSWQQDYAVIGVTNLNWIEHAWIIDINNTALPKPIYPLEAVRDLERTYKQYGRPGQVCWLPNDQLMYGSWGDPANNSGCKNPGPNVTYTQPLGATVAPANPITQIKDHNGNLLLLTTYGTCGETEPTWPAAKAAVGTTVQDGTCVWTVIDPKGQGFRVSPLPPQTSVVYQVNVVGQMKAPQFVNFAQTLDPIPDDYATYFRQGFVAHCYRHSPDQKVRGKFAVEYQLWMQAISELVKNGDKEIDSAGFYPSRGIMEAEIWGVIGPGNPYGF